MGIAIKFIGGLVMTLLYVIAVPYVTDTYITPFIIESVGDTGFAYISSETLTHILFLLVTVGFILLLGGGAILRWFGLFGILGMIVAYWLLGNVSQAIYPITSIVVVSVTLWALRSRKKAKERREKKASQKE